MVQPTLRLANVGGLANRMIELIFARSLQTLLPDLLIANISLPEWNIHHADVEPRGVKLQFPIQMEVGVQRLAETIRASGADFIEYLGYAQHMSNFVDDKEMINSLFPISEEEGFDENTLVINIRGDEILDGRHPGYPLVPIAFYEKVLQTTGLRPVFFGQLTPSVYIDALRSSFPNALFVNSLGALRDFDILRKSKHIIPAISTFSWLASWLSSASIHFPILGLFNPFQETDHMLLPLSDSRYSFYLFPVSFSVPVDSYGRSHAAIENRWELISADCLRSRVSDAPRRKASMLDFIYAFDPTFYLSFWNDIRNQFGEDVNLARNHYISFGHQEKRAGFQFDERWYLLNHPDAASLVGRGEYATTLDHYLLSGIRAGYRPFDPFHGSDLEI